MNKISLKENITEIIAIIVIFMSYVFLLLVAFKGIPPENKDLVNLSVGFIIGTSVAGVIGYYFGTSKKRDIIPEAGQSVTTVQKSITTDDSK